MANAFYTPTVVAKEFLKQLETSLVLGKLVGTDYSNEFTMVGSSVKVRRQPMYLGQDNNLDLSSFTEDVEEGTATITMNTTWSDKVKIGAVDRSLSFDRWSDFVIKPMAQRAAEKIEASIMAQYYNAYWFDGTAGSTAATFAVLAGAGAIMDDANINQMNRVGLHSPAYSASLADGLKGVYVQDIAKNAITAAKIGDYAGFTNYKTVFAPTHTVGVNTGTPLVNGASQNVTYATCKDTWSQSLITDGWTNSQTGILKAGDVFTIANVYAVNPSTKASTGRLQTFTVLADANSGATTGPATLTISPPIISSGAYQTVTAAPADNAAITVKTGTGGTAYRQSLLMDPTGITVVSRPLDIPQGAGVKSHVEQGNIVSIAVSEYTTGDTLAHNMRFDMLWQPVLLDPRKVMRLTN
jgi:hypothetical protein